MKTRPAKVWMRFSTNLCVIGTVSLKSKCQKGVISTCLQLNIPKYHLPSARYYGNQMSSNNISVHQSEELRRDVTFDALETVCSVFTTELPEITFAGTYSTLILFASVQPEVETAGYSITLG